MRVRGARRAVWQSAGCCWRSRSAAVWSVGGRRPEKAPERGKKKGREGKLRRLTRKSAGGRRGAGDWQRDKCAVQGGSRVRTRKGDVRGRSPEPDDRAADACGMAAGARQEQRREKTPQGAGAQPENSGSPRGSLPAPCPSRSAWVGGSGRWTWRRYLRGGNREAWSKGGKGRRGARPGGASHSRSARRMGPGRGCGEARAAAHASPGMRRSG